MKKLLILAVMIVMTFSLTACGSDNGSSSSKGNGNTGSDSMSSITDSSYESSSDSTKKDIYLNATVLSVSDDKITVRPENNDNNNNADEKIISSDSIEFDAGILPTFDLTDIKTGDKIRIVYDKDSVNDSYSKIDTVYTVYRIDDKGEIIANH